MKQPIIADVTAREELDSRGDPTLRATVVLSSGKLASAAVPSGASTGRHEAHELRDGTGRFRGKSVGKAVMNVSTVMKRAIAGMKVHDQRKIDAKLIELDGTKDRSRLGANAMLSVSLATARAASSALDLPLYQYLQQAFDLPQPAIFPKPMCNLINGGVHADSGVSFQEYLVLGNGGKCAQQIEHIWRVMQRLREILSSQGERTLLGDEGGFAPKLKSNEQGLALLKQAAQESELTIPDDVGFGLDTAADEFFQRRRGVYRLQPEARELNPHQLIDWYDELSKRYSLQTLEDGLYEDDWQNWSVLTRRLGSRMMIIGDDLFVTKVDRLERGIRVKAGNAILIKPNQVGTLSETIETVTTAHKNHYACVVSHRSGETCDDFITDLAVAIGSPYLKAGSLMRGERVAKYNRLLAIADEVDA